MNGSAPPAASAAGLLVDGESRVTFYVDPSQPRVHRFISRFSMAAAATAVGMVARTLGSMSSGPMLEFV